jgi:hypothetical protein
VRAGAAKVALAVHRKTAHRWTQEHIAIAEESSTSTRRSKRCLVILRARSRANRPR